SLCTFMHTTFSVISSLYLHDALPISFSLGGTDQWFRTLGEYIQQMYKDTLGVEVKVEQLEWPVFDSNVNNGDFQIGYMAWTADLDRKSTRLNSSHVSISYAVFCLKKK